MLYFNHSNQTNQDQTKQNQTNHSNQNPLKENSFWVIRDQLVGEYTVRLQRGDSGLYVILTDTKSPYSFRVWGALSLQDGWMLYMFLIDQKQDILRLLI